MKQPQRLYEGNMKKNYLLYAIPLILSAIMTQSYNLVNSMMIGKFIGSEAFAATAVTAQFIQAIEAVFWGYLTGIGIYVSVLFGKNEYQKMFSIIKVNFLLSSAIAILISVLCNVFYKQIFAVLNVSDEVYANARLYFCTYISGLVFSQLSWGFTYVSNALGLTKIPLIISVLSGVINIILNYVFLVVLGKGIGYCALSTVTATLLSGIYYFFKLIRLFKSMGINLKETVFGKLEAKQSIDFGIPTMFQQIAMYACSALVSPLTNTCSTAAISGYEIANKSKTLIAAVYQNSSKANTTLVAQAMGAGRIDKIKEGIKIGTTQSLIIFFGVMGLFVIFAKEFTGLFIDPVTDAESFRVSVNLIRYILPLILFNVFNNLFHGIFRAVGSGTIMLVSTLIYAVSLVIYSYLFFKLFAYEYRIYAIYLALGASYITEVIFAGIIFVSGKWKTPEYRELEKQEFSTLP